jgi:hypothetical protein
LYQSAYLFGDVSAFPGFARCARYDLPAILPEMHRTSSACTAHAALSAACAARAALANSFFEVRPSAKASATSTTRLLRPSPSRGQSRRTNAQARKRSFLGSAFWRS